MGQTNPTFSAALCPASGDYLAKEHKLSKVCGIHRKGHYTRALEEAIQTHTSQWPSVWQGKNPLHGGGSFNKMSPENRVWSTSISNGYLAANSLYIAHTSQSTHFMVIRVLRSRTSHHEGVLQETTAGR